MTRAADSLEQPLRLLREARLRPGFEERLAERLATAAPESNILRGSRWKYRRGIFLLAALALPAGALAARGFFQAKHSDRKVENSVQQLQSASVRKPAVVTNVASPKSEQPRPTPGLEDAPKRGAPAMSEHRKAVPPLKRTEQRTQDARSAAQPTAAAFQAKPRAAIANSAPAIIESLDVGIPRRGATNDAKASVGDRGSAATGLRSAASERASRAAVTRERFGADRERAAEHRGNEGAQQARERVQARERKGQ